MPLPLYLLAFLEEGFDEHFVVGVCGCLVEVAVETAGEVSDGEGVWVSVFHGVVHEFLHPVVLNIKVKTNTFFSGPAGIPVLP